MSNTQNMFSEGTPMRRVIDYAAKEFFAKGVRQVTMDDIAKGLQMSKRTLYQLFADKEQLIIACIQVLAEKEHNMVQSLQEQNYNTLEITLRIIEYRLRRMTDVSCQYMADITRYKSVMEYIRLVREESIVRACTFLNQGKAQGLFRPDVNFSIVMHSMLLQADNLTLYNEFNRDSIEEYFINIGIFHLRGCCTPHGIELIDNFLDYYRTNN